ncbi:MAG: T9SS type A sorting domain-containing protein, partial [Candidatus Cloacimonetes bacterium]|nr:T9SS type A sorting domain-containing protein [Candidatus Cloacimonadota bacterium]
YNVKGQKVKTLVKERMDAGNHSVIWNGDDDNGETVCSGVYFYKLSAGNEIKVKKAIIVK